jgi:hypothetical protein
LIWKNLGETTVIANQWSPGFSDARHHVYWTDRMRHVGAPADAHESDHVEWVSLERVPSPIAGGHIKAAHTVAALLTLRELRTTAALKASSQPPAS